MKLDTDVLEKTLAFTITLIGPVLSIQLLARNKPCHVVLQLYVCVKLSRNQSWVNLLFPVSRDSILKSILDRLFWILYFVIHVVKVGKVCCRSIG